MSFYDEKHFILVKEFDYHSCRIQIFWATKGARHCGINHHPDELECKHCQATLKPQTCYVACINGNIMTDFPSVFAAITGVKALFDKKDADRDEPEPADEVEIDLNDEEDEEDEEENDMPDPKKGGMTPQMEKMVKLGWPAKLKALARECLPKKPKNGKKPLPPKR